MSTLIILASIVLLVVGIIYLFIYVNTPNQFDPNSAAGRMENRFKREAEQNLYQNIVMPLLKLVSLIILGAIFLFAAWITGNL